MEMQAVFLYVNSIVILCQRQQVNSRDPASGFWPCRSVDRLGDGAVRIEDGVT